MIVTQGGAVVIHPVLTKYLIKLEMTESVDHDYDLPKEEMASSAVYPSMLSLKLENLQWYPQVISIEASSDSGNIGVTVQDVLRTINEDPRMPIPTHELSKLSIEEWAAIDGALERDACTQRQCITFYVYTRGAPRNFCELADFP